MVLSFAMGEGIYSHKRKAKAFVTRNYADNGFPPGYCQMFVFRES